MGFKILFVTSDTRLTNRRFYQQYEFWKKSGWSTQVFTPDAYVEVKKDSKRNSLRSRFWPLYIRRLRKLFNLDRAWIRVVIQENRRIFFTNTDNNSIFTRKIQSLLTLFAAFVFELRFLQIFFVGMNDNLLRISQDPAASTPKNVVSDFLDVVKVFDPDVIWLENYYSWSIVKNLSGERPPYIIYDAPEFAQGSPNLSPVIKERIAKLEGAAIARADYFTCTSVNILEVFRETYTGRFPDARVLNNASQYISFPERLDRDLGREVNKSFTSSRRAIYHGALISDRNLELLVRIFSNGLPSWELFIMGDGPLLGDLRAVAGPNITFLPYADQENIGAILADMDVCVVPYEAKCLNHKYSVANKFFDSVGAGVKLVVNEELLVLESWIDEYQLGGVVPIGTPNALISFLENDFDKLPTANFEGFLREHGWEKQLQTLSDLRAKIEYRLST
jgi:hypothetical protein